MFCLSTSRPRMRFRNLVIEQSARTWWVREHGAAGHGTHQHSHKKSHPTSLPDGSTALIHKRAAQGLFFQAVVNCQAAAGKCDLQCQLTPTRHSHQSKHRAQLHSKPLKAVALCRWAGWAMTPPPLSFLPYFGQEKLDTYPSPLRQCHTSSDCSRSPQR